MNSKLFFCLQCKKASLIQGKCFHCSYLYQFQVQDYIKPSSWERFKNWLYFLDYGYIVALLAAVILNTLFLHHFKFTVYEAFIEAFCLGIIITRLIKD